MKQRVNQEYEIRPNGTLRVKSVNPDAPMTQQQFKQDCDVNYIMEKFLKTGVITHTRNPGQYLDLVDMPDYNEAALTVARANSAFEELDAHVRLRFNNDPAQFIEFLADENNEDEAVKLGLRIPRDRNPIVDELQTLNKTISSTADTKTKSTTKKDSSKKSESEDK